MSLINDALKRAKQSQQRQPQTAPVALTIPPVEVKPPGGASRLVLVVFVLLIAVVCCFIANVFFAPQKPVVRPVQPPAPVLQKSPSMSPPRPATAPTVAAAASKPAPAPSVAIVAPKSAQPAPPALKVQGIFYNDAKWQAIVNGQSIIVGDSVDDFRVKLITKNNVLFVAPDGTEKTLALGE